MSKLDAAGIHQPITELAKAGLEKLEVFSSIASTNTYLMAQSPPAAGRFRVAIADHQTSGRGRHFRRWLSAPGSGLCLSLAYTFSKPPGEIEGLTLAIGVGVVRALRQLDVPGIGLKWPNDIVALDGKLGGILTEVQSGGRDTATVVTGIGLNVDMQRPMDFSADSAPMLRAVDLKSVAAAPPSRELLAGTLVDQLYLTMRHFEVGGLAVFMDDWRRWDWLRDKVVTVDMDDRQVSGVAAGVDERGVLMIQSEGATVRVISGSIIVPGLREASQ
jgi:BirA family biotin operon repressor/biotin-[acetyl-CoA-carboxylase] ligase